MIRVVSSHHEALGEWARYRRGLDSAPALFTCDHHTDTLPAFGRAAADEADRLRRVAAFDYRSDSSIAEALALLRHDEQIDLALRGGVVKRAVIVAYGAEDEAERDLFRRLVARNARNMSFESYDIRFVDEADVETAVKEITERWNEK